MNILDEAKNLINRLKNLRYHYSELYMSGLRELSSIKKDDPDFNILRKSCTHAMGIVSCDCERIVMHTEALEKSVNENNESELQEYLKVNRDDINRLFDR